MNEVKQSNKYVTIYTEANPNPNSMKFVANYMLVGFGNTYDFPDVETAQKQSQLAEELFTYDYVERVFIMNNFVTVTKKSDIEWQEIVTELKNHIQSYLEADKAILKAENLEVIDENEPEIHKKIRNILDEYIKPAVESDGGAISFHSYHEGTVKVLLQGSCSGCPSSTMTLKAGIENLLTNMLPNEVKEVVAEGV